MANFNTLNSAKALHLDVQGIAPVDVIPEWLGISTSSKAGFVDGDEPTVRVPYVSLDADFVAEGTDIPLAAPESTEVVISTGKVAVLVGVSREQYAQGNAATLLSDAVRRALIRKANSAYLGQVAPTNPNRVPPAGLTKQGLTDGGSLGANLDAFADGVALIESAGGTANFVLAHPAAWGAISKLKDKTDSNASLIGAGVDAAQRTLLGVPVYVDRDVPLNDIIVGDKSAVLSAYGNVEVAVSEDYLFNSDSVAVRATFRFGAKVADVKRCVQISVAASPDAADAGSKATTARVTVK